MIVRGVAQKRLRPELFGSGLRGSKLGWGTGLLLGVSGDDGGLDVGEGDVEVVTNQAESGEDDDGDQGGDHAVLHRGHAGLIGNETVEKAGHGELLKWAFSLRPRLQ